MGESLQAAYDSAPTKIKAADFARQAGSSAYNGIGYDVLDCQAFVEKVLKDCGYSYNWRGSNDMWRNALDWSGTYDEAVKKFGEIPPGAWLFTIKKDGKEDKSRYKDGINAAHVGIYLGSGKARHSTTGGVQYCAVPAGRWTHVGLAKIIDYNAPDDHTDISNKEVYKDSAGNIWLNLTKFIKGL